MKSTVKNRNTSYTTFKEALDLRQSEIISIVGGGGKTTLMFSLSRELVSEGKSVITTTTTKIMEPLTTQTHCLIVGKDEEEILLVLQQNLDKYKHVTLVSQRLTPNKLNGISPEFVTILVKMKLAPYIIIEADGAAQKSLKAPGVNEPVIPINTTLVIPVVGIDVLGKPLNDKFVFRPEIVSFITGVSLNETISIGNIAILMNHPYGIIKGVPGSSRIVPFINKADNSNLQSDARKLAEAILAQKNPKINRVVIGSLQSSKTVLEVIGL